MNNKNIAWTLIAIGGITLGVLVWSLLSKASGSVWELGLFGSILLVMGIYMLRGYEIGV